MGLELNGRDWARARGLWSSAVETGANRARGTAAAQGLAADSPWARAMEQAAAVALSRSAQLALNGGSTQPAIRSGDTDDANADDGGAIEAAVDDSSAESGQSIEAVDSDETVEADEAADSGEGDDPQTETLRAGGFVAQGIEVTITIRASGSDYRNAIVVSRDGGASWTELGYDNENVDQDITLQSDPDEPLLFGIVSPDGARYVAGREDLSDDGLAHARVEEQDDGSLRIGFEDLAGGGDLDFDDAVIELRNARWSDEAAFRVEQDPSDAEAEQAEQAAEAELEAMHAEAEQAAELQAQEQAEASLQAEQEVTQAQAEHALHGAMNDIKARRNAQFLESFYRSLAPAEDEPKDKDRGYAADDERGRERDRERSHRLWMA